MDDSSPTPRTSSSTDGGKTGPPPPDWSEALNRAVASSRDRASTTSSTDLTRRMAPLRVHPTPILDLDRGLRFSPTKRREIHEVDEVILRAFRGLVGGTQPWPAFVTGPPGCGKTCAALALLDHVSTGVYTTAAELTERAFRSFNGGPPINWRQWFAPDKCDLVVLDELGARKSVSDTHYEQVQKVLDIREGAPLVVVTNLTLAEVAQVYDDRIASRCGAGTVVTLWRSDVRDRRID